MLGVIPRSHPRLELTYPVWKIVSFKLRKIIYTKAVIVNVCIVSKILSCHF